MSRSLLRVSCLVVISCLALATAAEAADVAELLKRPIIDANLAWNEVREFCKSRVPPTPEPESVEQWEQFANQTRENVLNNVVFRGDAAEWREMPTEPEWLETIDGGPEYVIRKLRFQAVPGMWIPALLYEPKELEGQVPVVLNVNGHDGNGKVAEYKQTRCINQAKRGMLALNLEWVGMGQLRSEGFVHYRMNQLDLCGTSGLAPFFLSMSRGLDILLEHEHADPERVAVAGLSGGGWQTIFISSLDTRVTLCDPVAGYSSFITRGDVTSDLGDSEQTPTDLGVNADYATLTAIRAPRPMLLTFNDRDNCCFAAGHALPPLLDAARPVYQMYGKLENLVAHVNHLPGDHNFGKDNREALYRMIGEHFYAGEEFDWREIECSDEIKTAEQLHVDLPKGNADFNALARRLMEDLPREAGDESAAARRDRLAEIVRANDLAVTAAELAHAEKADGLQANYWQLKVGDSWTIPAVELIPNDAKGAAVVVADGGRVAAATQINELLAAGKRVLAVDPFYFGESKIAQRDFLYGLLVATVGERPLGIQADQIAAVSRWLVGEQQAGPVTVVAVGRRTGLGALVAAALEEEAIGELRLHQPFTSLKQVIEESLQIPDGPEMFCFGLLAEFDVPEITALVEPREVAVVE
ncbi:MAG: hypothetical protein DWQ45_16785 [Planctomycetota bacterium]|nr:MAG: hypothetical protein DWQ41_20660 [Planctomycetota bacterium]REK32753.1 MAG: hypothetical protein DWQ45_16785 [Planctomycetota bacterium]